MVERETFPVDVLVVGAGSAGLAFAIKLARQLKERGLDKSIMVLDKAGQPGHHSLSGAVMDPQSILELFPDARERGFPVEAEVAEDALWVLSKNSKFSLKGMFLPKPFRNQGNWIVAASTMSTWLCEQADAFECVDVYHGTAAAEVLYDEHNRVRGVRTVDMGRGPGGEEKPNFEPGMDITADLVIFAEGPRGSLSKSLIDKLSLDADSNPQLWAVGVKEIWDVEHDIEGDVIHTAGWPLSTNTYGGGWIYGLPGNRLSIGFVVGMDHGDASFDYHAAMQRWKTHPALAKLLNGGKLASYGAKTVPEGGLYSMPRLFGDGFMLIGDTAGFLNAQRLKGLHLGIKSGMLAADAAIEALIDNDCSAGKLVAYEQFFRKSWAFKELNEVRNFRAGFQKGFLRGMLGAALGVLSGGKLSGPKVGCEADHERYRLGTKARVEPPKFDGELTFEKSTSVFHSGCSHPEDQPSHLVITDTDICVNRCTVEYGNPCQYFCPAEVYDWQGEKGLQINFSNCVHCKTCDIADPYQVINWVVPETGGPIYSGM